MQERINLSNIGDQMMLMAYNEIAHIAYNDMNNAQLWVTARCACITGEISIAEKAIKGGWDVNGRLNPDGDTMLTMSIRHGNTTLSIWLLDNGADPNCSLYNGRTPLITAAGCGDVSVIRHLLSRRVAIDQQMNNGATALMYAMAKRQMSAARCLISMGASSSLKDNDGWSALDYANKSLHSGR